MSEQSPAGFTVKEMLVEIVIPDLKAIKENLDNKADRSEVNALDSRMTHMEASAADFLRRSGPIALEIQQQEHRVEELEKENIRRENVIEDYEQTKKLVLDNAEAIRRMPDSIQKAISKALEGYDTRRQTKADRQFSRWDRIILSFLGIVGAIGTVVSTVVIVTHT